MNDETLYSVLQAHADAIDEIASRLGTTGSQQEVRAVAGELRRVADNVWIPVGDSKPAPENGRELVVCFDDGDTQRAIYREGAFLEREYNPYSLLARWCKLRGVKEWRYLGGDEK